MIISATGMSTGSVIFTGAVNHATINGNGVNNMVFLNTIGNTSICSNLFRAFEPPVSSISVAMAVTNTNISNNTSESTSNFTFSAAVTGITVSGNQMSGGDVIFLGDCDQLIFSDNNVNILGVGVAPTPVTLTFDNSIITDNTFDDDIDIFADVTNTRFTNCVGRTAGGADVDVVFQGTFTNSEFSGFYGDDLVFNGRVDRSTIMRNMGQRINFNGGCIESTISHNILQGDPSIVFAANSTMGMRNTVTQCTINGNFIGDGGGIAMRDGASECAIVGNFIHNDTMLPTGEGIIFFGSGMGPNLDMYRSEENTVCGNVAEGIRFESDTAAGVPMGNSRNAITGNKVIVSGITVVMGGSAGDNVVIGNNTAGTITNFGAGETTPAVVGINL
jgi:hypothetical protein